MSLRHDGQCITLGPGYRDDWQVNIPGQSDSGFANRPGFLAVWPVLVALGASFPSSEDDMIIVRSATSGC